MKTKMNGPQEAGSGLFFEVPRATEGGDGLTIRHGH
jgi:hypothetical protein